MSANNTGRQIIRPRRCATTILLVLVLAVSFAQMVRTAPGTDGQWRTLPYLMPINPIHMALLNNGKVLIIAGSGNDATVHTFESTVWDPQTGSFAPQSWWWDMFCNGMVTLADGRVFINGGNLTYDPFTGEPKNAVYDPATDTFTDVESMAHGRWYPTTTILGDGRVMTFSGLTETGSTNTTVEIYTPGSGWSPEYPAGWTPPLYPRLHLIADGRVFYSGAGRPSRMFNPSTKTWSTSAMSNYSNSRTYGTSVLLPLRPPDYKSRVMIMGGGNPATATTEIIDLTAATPQWQYGPPMSQPRIEMNATILPSGKVLALGGSEYNEEAATKSLNADLYDPSTNTFASAGANAFPRLYHSSSLLLPDATVALVGGNPNRGAYQREIEIYTPAYLFNPDNTPAVRPTITGITPGTLRYGAQFQVQTADAAQISSVVLVRPGAPTHAFDMDQRLVGLPYTAGSGVLNVTAPPNGNIAPPGDYMLFILNAAGVPSVATFVRVSASAANQLPTATIVSPEGSATVQAGQSVFFSGSGSDPDGSITAHAWTFPGGSPGSSSSATPGNVTYSTPGTYVASLTVTDDAGGTSSPATRPVTVPDFSLSAAPASRAVWPGGSTNYTIAVSPGTGFNGDVAFSVSGLPAGATRTFTPASVPASGSTTLSVSTTSATPPGNYPLVITGSTAAINHTVAVTLIVNADFSISVAPSSLSITRGAKGNYAVTVSAGQGFTGTVNFSVSGLPKFANAKFTPTSVVNSGNAVMTVTTNRNTTPGTYSVSLTGTSGAIVHSVPLTLIIQ